MKSLTLNLDDRYGEVLEELAQEQGMSQTSLLKQALRLYQEVHLRAKRGEQLAFVKDGQVVPTIVVGLGELW